MKTKTPGNVTIRVCELPIVGEMIRNTIKRMAELAAKANRAFH